MKARGRVVAAVLTAAALTGSMGQVAIAAPAGSLQDSPPYEREEFGDGWVDLDGDGCDTRQEILARDLVGEVLAADGCRVLSGTLEDPTPARRSLSSAAPRPPTTCRSITWCLSPMPGTLARGCGPRSS